MGGEGEGTHGQVERLEGRTCVGEGDWMGMVVCACVVWCVRVCLLCVSFSLCAYAHVYMHVFI